MHVLMPGQFETPADMAGSNLASVRMRVVPAALALQARGTQVTWGEQVQGTPDRVLVAKIGGHDIAARQAQWLQQIAQARRCGASIWVDYTDHHLGYASVMSGFYASVLELADAFTVPSACMQRLLSGQWQGPVQVVPDAIEVDCVVPKNAHGEPVTALWFGHASNVAYLRTFLEEGLVADQPLRLIVLSNQAGLDILTARPIEARVPLDILVAEWSIDTMREAAQQSDVCLIPSDTQDPKKMAVSANRLITALALGLPTAADWLESYAEFGAYFTDIRSGELAALLQQPTRHADRVAEAQRSVVPRFAQAAVSAAWARVLG
ncbi:hypothetical protein [uncultured Rhodoferax sp.]|uniref:hypothetical protein n=1 Tax=uncultured Rhodoferax sp. TaxID=223188 RepID=UPI0025F74452|nr:hypothetical protein [uncultured Rhodoferax sp.]